MAVLHLPDVRLHYEVEGDGPPLILIAGMMSDGASWGPVVQPLAKRFTVIRPDNRTTGRTLPLDAPAGLAEWAGDVLALMDHLGLARAHVAGHSLGGLIGLHLAGMAPGRVETLALLASAPVFLPRNLGLFRLLLRLRDEGMAQDLWLRGLFPWLFHPRVFEDGDLVETMLALSLGYPHAQGRDAMARQVEAFAAAEGVLRVPDTLPPTVAVLAVEDALFPLAVARAALEPLAIPVVEVAGAGHSVHWDAPEAVVAALVAHAGGGL
jgi:pimeloyl-ACP methyl ester carboxylesterase